MKIQNQAACVSRSLHTSCCTTQCLAAHTFFSFEIYFCSDITHITHTTHTYRYHSLSTQLRALRLPFPMAYGSILLVTNSHSLTGCQFRSATACSKLTNLTFWLRITYDPLATLCITSCLDNDTEFFDSILGTNFSDFTRNRVCTCDIDISIITPY